MNKSMLIRLMICLLLVLPISFYAYQWRLKYVDSVQKIKNMNKVTEYLFDMQMKGFKEDEKYLNNVKLFDVKGKEVQLKDVVKNKRQLVIYLPNISCSACVDAELVCFSYKQDDKEASIPAAFISNFQNKRDIGSFSNAYNFENVYSTCDGEELGIFSSHEENKSMKPMIFILDEDLKISSSFFSDKAFPSRTEEYLKVVIKRLNR